MILSLSLLIGLASADQTVMLDWDTAPFDFSAFGATSDLDDDLIKVLVLEEFKQNYADFEVHFTTETPRYGNFSRLLFSGSDPRADSNTWGTVSSRATVSGFTGTSLSSWDDGDSVAHVFLSTFAGSETFTGANATEARIANGIAGTAAHELGHLFGLSHEHACDGYPDIATCAATAVVAAHPDTDEHIMASGPYGGLATAERATVDRYFAPFTSTEVLAQEIKPRNYHRPLSDLDADGAADLVGRIHAGGLDSTYTALST